MNTWRPRRCLPHTTATLSMFSLFPSLLSAAPLITAAPRSFVSFAFVTRLHKQNHWRSPLSQSLQVHFVCLMFDCEEGPKCFAKVSLCTKKKKKDTINSGPAVKEWFIEPRCIHLSSESLSRAQPLHFSPWPGL